MTLAPLPIRSLIVGRAARMRVSSVIAPASFRGVEINPHENAFAAQVAGVEAGRERFAMGLCRAVRKREEVNP